MTRLGPGSDWTLGDETIMRPWKLTLLGGLGVRSPPEVNRRAPSVEELLGKKTTAPTGAMGERTAKSSESLKADQPCRF